MKQYKSVALAVALVLSGAGFAGARTALAAEQTEVTLELPAQSLAASLRELARQADIQIAVQSELTDGKTASRISGTYQPADALQALLEGWDLVAYRINEHTFGIRSIHTSPSSSTLKSPEHIRLAQAEAPAKETAHLEEIIVTAQKREERLQDVPVPVTAIGADLLVNSNQMRLQDYYTKVPGLSLSLLGDAGVPLITIRGISTGGYTNATVGIAVDDVPFGSSTGVAGGATVPDFDPSELAGIEVLRGPQGTLYGASSPGGLLKYVTVDPGFDGFSSRVQAGTTSVENGDGIGYNLRGSMNVPLSDTIAIRASAFTRSEPGYIDDPVLGIEGVNKREAEGGRFAALWRPSDAFSVRLSALLQNTERHGEDTVHLLPSLSDLQHADLVNTGWLRQKFQAYSATVTAELGRAQLTSLSGFSIGELSSALDATAQLGGFTQQQFGVSGTKVVVNPQKTEKFSQELRLFAPLSEHVDWLVGAFYTRERSPNQTNILAIDSVTGAAAGTWIDADYMFRFVEKAAFTTLTFNITEQFDVQVGGRASRFTTEAGEEHSVGPYNSLLGKPSTYDFRGAESEDDAFTYLLTPRWRLSPDLMLYARLASGYRPGGPNPFVTAGQGLPTEYGPDTTQNYEIGFKGYVLGGIVSFDASLYYIDWKDIQLQLRAPVTNVIYYTNAGEARSQGAELSMQSRPLEGLKVEGWVAYTDAELTDVPAASLLVARPGDRLPYSSRFSGNLSLEQEFPLSNAVTGFVGASVSYVDDRKGRFFANALPRQDFPSYTQIDLRGGASLDTWTVNLFLNNAADKRGVIRGGRDASLSLAYARTYIQPRTFGLSITKSF